MVPKQYGRRIWTFCIAIWTALLAAAPQGAQAEPVEEFYKGKTLRVVVGYAPGGGYDIHGRMFAEYFSRYLPGHPVIVVQNMPGAGSFIAAKYMYNIAPKDGTVFACLAQTLPLDAAMQGEQPDLDITKLPYLGRLAANIDFGIGKPGSWFKNFDDARRREIVIGATGGSSPGYILPMALSKYAGAKFKIISGYSGSADILLAVERGEVDVVASIGMPAVLAHHPDWIKERTAPILYQGALHRHPLLPDVPTIPELAQSEDGKAVLTTIAVSSEIGRSILTTPGVPPERLAALRAAFHDMVHDPKFVQAIAQRDLAIEPLAGEELDSLTREAIATPPRILTMTSELLKLQP